MLYKSGFESTDYKPRFTAGSYLFSADPCEPPYSADDTREDFFSERGHERRRGVSRFDHFLWCQKGRGDLSVSSLDFKTTGAQSGHILTLHSLQLMNSYRQEADVCISWGWCRDASTLPSFKRLNDEKQNERWTSSEVTWRSVVYCGLFGEKSRYKCSTAAFWIIYCFKGNDW